MLDISGCLLQLSFHLDSPLFILSNWIGEAADLNALCQKYKSRFLKCISDIDLPKLLSDRANYPDRNSSICLFIYLFFPIFPCHS